MEFLKLLDAEIIYPISDSQWISASHVVPKKIGFTIVANNEGEMITQRIKALFRMVLDYHRLNKATKKDNFPLPNMELML